MASFKWVNTTLGNIKSRRSAARTYRKLGPATDAGTAPLVPKLRLALQPALVNSRQCIPRFVHERRITETSLMQNISRTYILISRMTFRDKQDSI